MIHRVVLGFAVLWCILTPISAYAGTQASSGNSMSKPSKLVIDDFVSSVLGANNAIEGSRQRWLARHGTVSSAASLPDPMVMFAYKNDGFEDISYGDMEGSEWMTSVSQTFPFWGKRGLKRSSAQAEADALGHAYNTQRLGVERKARELFLDLFFTHKANEILGLRMELLSNIEHAALNRYAKGMASQPEVIMVQSDKYMIVERQEMLLQKRKALEAAASAMLNAEPSSTPWVPATPAKSPTPEGLEHYLALVEASPMVQEKRMMLSSAQSMESLARKEYYPDFTLTAQVNQRPEPFTDMWQVSMSFNVPIYYKDKQRAELGAAQQRREAFASDLAETIRVLQAEVLEAHAMALTSERLMGLYEGGFVAKNKQSFESTLTAYSNGKVEVIALLQSLAVLTDYEISYWERFVEREKALARIHAVTTGVKDMQAGKDEQK